MVSTMYRPGFRRGDPPAGPSGRVVNDLRRVADRPPSLTDPLAVATSGNSVPHRAPLFRLAVYPSHRRAGIARRLVAGLESRLRKLGCLRVNLMVMPDNVDGLRFWQALGYLPVPDVLCRKPL